MGTVLSDKMNMMGKTSFAGFKFGILTYTMFVRWVLYTIFISGARNKSRETCLMEDNLHQIF